MQASKIDKKRSMRSLLGAAVCVWWCMMMMVFIMPSILAIEADECGQQLDYNTAALPSIPFDVRLGERCYSKFLTRLRNLVQASPRACGLPSTRRVPLRGTEYVQVDLKFSNTKWVTLGIDAKDLYIWGYQDKYNGTYRAVFLKDAPLLARNTLFSESTTNRTTRFEGTYNELQRYADKNKRDQTIGIPNLESSLKEVYGKPEGEVSVQTEARFFLMVVQMVSEAARFKFIETAICEYNNKEEIKLKLSGFVNDWDKISYAIHRAENQTMNKCTVIRPPIEVGNTDYKLMVNNVDDIKSDMALLKYMPIPTSNLVDNVDVDRTIIPKSAVM